MVQINFAQKSVNVKIVYYGPGMSGKTTNLEVVHQRAPQENRGELTSISTDGDRTLFFDYMPLELGTVAGMRTCFQVYTVPGQVYYNSTRKLVLQGVDGVIFVADSAPSMLEQNLESLRNLEENLNEYGKSLSSLPHVVQWNKRDLGNAMAVEELERHLNLHKAPTFEAVANTGQGVFPTLKALATLVLKSVMQEATGGGAPRAASAQPAQQAADGQFPASDATGAQPQIQPGPLATPQTPGSAIPPSVPGYDEALAPAAQAQPLQTPVGPPAGTLPGEAPELDTVAQPSAPAVPNPYAPVQPDRAAAQAPAEPQLELSTRQPSAPAQVATGTPEASQQVQRRTQSPAELMRVGQTAAAKAAARTKSRSHAAPASARAYTKPAPVKTPKKKGSAVATGVFILFAAGAGAALAWVVLTVL
jgi:signal recognition particle receptor subunit beta